MQLFDLKQELKQNKIRPLYIFTGPEVGIMNAYVDQIKKIINFNGQCSLVDNFSDIVQKINLKSFMGNFSMYRIKDDKEILDKQNYWDLLEKLPRDKIVIFIFSNLKKTSLFYKRFENIIVNFDRLTVDQLSKYSQKQLNLQKSYADILANICQKDYNRMLLECDKIKTYSKLFNVDNNRGFKECLDNGLIYQEAEDVLFPLIDAVCRNEKNRAFDLLSEYKEVDDTPLGFLTLLYNNIRQILMVQGLGDNKDVASRTGLTGYQVKLAMEKMGRYNIRHLVDSLRIITNIDKGIKSGELDSSRAAELALCMILR